MLYSVGSLLELSDLSDDVRYLNNNKKKKCKNVMKIYSFIPCVRHVCMHPPSSFWRS